MKAKIKQIVNLIDKSKRILITSHKDPDGDSIGSQLALAELLKRKNKQFKIMNQGEMPIKYHFLDRNNEIITRPPKKSFKADLVIILECSNLDRIGWVKNMIHPEAKIITIDHHSEDNCCGTVNYSDPLASAVGEMIYDIFEYLNYPLDAKIATWLYSAILTDTGRFRFINTTPRSLEICANLIKWGANPRFITDRIYFDHQKSYMQLLGNLLTHMEFFENNRICCFTLKQSAMKKYGIASAETE
ncbi:MAG: bifunctional oligoribonuclease/PAP phosphatase NrnA, partial [candidate division Zixibacteria bacterium]|nr:bifunctional oligoribonuclease/PAP phosphatase NrnA [candidate division Zixibacteria bacterium]